MDIIDIERAIARIAQGRGYAPIVASEQEVERSIVTMPTAWIELPKVLYVEGRNEGIIGHKVYFTLLDNGGGYSSEEKVVRFNQMRDDTLEIMTQLSLEEGIVEIADMTSTPKAFTTTRHTDIGQKCEATVVSYF